MKYQAVLGIELACTSEILGRLGVVLLDRERRGRPGPMHFGRPSILATNPEKLLY